MKLLYIFITFFFILVLSESSYGQIPSYVPTNGLQAYYSFNGNVNDQTTNGNHLTNTSVTFGLDRLGQTNSAGVFNGSTAYLTRSVPSFTFSENGAFSYSMWMKKSNTTVGISIMVGTTTSNYFISIMQSNTGFQYGTNKQQSAWTWATSTVTANIWDHYVATYNNKVMKLYKNGVFQSTATFPYSGSISANLPLLIGKGVGGSFFNGLMDDIGIWNRELSPSEVSLLYNACNVSASISPTNLQLNIGDTLNLTTNTTGTITNYQWQKNTGAGYQNLVNGSSISGSTSNTLQINGINTADNSNFYRCYVSSTTCTDTSNSILLNVCGEKTIDPTNQQLKTNGSTQFIAGSNDPLASYQWQMIPNINIPNGAPFFGAMNDTLEIINPNIALNNKMFRCIISTGNCLDTTTSALLTVCGAVTTQPTNQTIYATHVAKFTILSSDPNSTYQWQEAVLNNFVNLTNSTNYVGVNSDSLSIPTVLLSQNGYKYRCIINSGLCADTSLSATLNVNDNVGIETSSIKPFSILYPNPAENIAYLDFNLYRNSNINYTIYNTIGQIVKQVSLGKIPLGNHTESIDLSNIAIGTYTIQIVIDSEIFNQKLIVK
jgi:hypothetical protein